MKNCKNCNSQVSDKFCSYCGEPIELKRIDGQYVLHEFSHVLHFDKGFFLTIKELILRPGPSVKEFVSTNRNRLIKPIVFIVITSLIYSILSHVLNIKGDYITFERSSQNDANLGTEKIFYWIKNHYGYVNILIGILISFWLKLFFKNKGYNFFEILILFCFVMGIGMLLFSVFSIFEALTGLHVMQISSFLFIVYYTWAVGQFFDKKNLISYIKVFSAYLIGASSFFILAIISGALYDYISKI